MKLQTTIKPRRDGTVIARNAKGEKFLFAPNEFGDLVADVTDEALVRDLLRNEDFLPYDTEDLAAAAALVGPTGGDGASDLDEIDHSEAGSPPGEGEELDDDEGDEEAAPVEGAAAQPVEAAPAAARPSRRRS